MAGATAKGAPFTALLTDKASVESGANDLLRLLSAGTDRAPRAVVIIDPNERGDIPQFRTQGFNGYLVRPVRPLSALIQLFGQETQAPARGISAARQETATDATPHANGLSVLLAEDNDINALLARALLTKLGHRPALATNGVDALESFFAARAAGLPFDLVLMDMRMPGLDGLEVARRIRAAEAASGEKRTPIVALTANAFPEDRAACLEAGMDDFLTKPLDRERLARTLEAVPARTPMAA